MLDFENFHPSLSREQYMETVCWQKGNFVLIKWAQSQCFAVANWTSMANSNRKYMKSTGGERRTKKRKKQFVVQIRDIITLLPSCDQNE